MRQKPSQDIFLLSAQCPTLINASFDARSRDARLQENARSYVSARAEVNFILPSDPRFIHSAACVQGASHWP